MVEETVSASDVREKFADFLDHVDTRRILIQKHGEPRAYLVSVQELQALEETLAVMEDSALISALKESLDQANRGQFIPAEDAFKRIESELAND